jgi:hypothetical protein
MITSDMVTEFELHRFETEASQLRWPVGHFPKNLETTMGNGQLFVRQNLDEFCAKYRQVLGCIELIVWND